MDDTPKMEDAKKGLVKDASGKLDKSAVKVSSRKKDRNLKRK